MTRRSVRDRLMQYTDRSGECWLWTASLRSGGYAQIYVNGRILAAHRVAYEEFVGPIPDGLQLDHLCRVRRCINPVHVEPVTLRENVARGVGKASHALRTNRCVNGHEFTSKNTRSRPGGRRCRACEFEKGQRRRVRNGLAVPSAPNATKTHCKRGHEFTPENTYWCRGCRQCRRCNRDAVRRYKARKKAVA